VGTFAREPVRPPGRRAEHLLGTINKLDTTAEGLAREVERLHRAGRPADAFDLALEAVRRFPQSSLAHTNAGYFYILRGEPALALRAYESAVLANPENAEARRGLAVAKTQCGIAAQGDSIATVPFRGAGAPIRVLVPITLGSGNVVTERLFDDRVFAVTKLAVELHPLDAPLPEHDVVFNAIGEADSAADALARASALLEPVRKRVLNDPRAVLLTGREAQARRLADLADVRVPHIRVVTRADARGLATPILLRAPGYHAGEHFERAESAQDVDRALERLPGEELFAIEFLDVRDADGLSTKYRVMAVDGVLYPLHLAISGDWKVHYFSAQMAAQPAFREREAAFLGDPQAALGRRAWNALQNVTDRLALDYAGIDFTLDVDGNVVVFETNATMAVRYPPEELVWAYRRPAVDAVLEAMRAMLVRYSSIETLPP
jgi:tetratricopeptide (TPR) repeat protein